MACTWEGGLTYVPWLTSVINLLVTGKPPRNAARTDAARALWDDALGCRLGGVAGAPYRGLFEEVDSRASAYGIYLRDLRHKSVSRVLDNLATSHSTQWGRRSVASLTAKLRDLEAHRRRNGAMTSPAYGLTAFASAGTEPGTLASEMKPIRPSLHTRPTA